MDNLVFIILKPLSPECYRFLVLVMPSASQFPGLIPDFLDLGVILNHDGVLKVSARPRVSSVAVETVFYKYLILNQNPSQCH